MKITDPFDEFGCLLFDETLMQERLPYPIYKRWKETVAKEDSLDQMCIRDSPCSIRVSVRADAFFVNTKKVNRDSLFLCF